jgi:hypothetical protein
MSTSYVEPPPVAPLEPPDGFTDSFAPAGPDEITNYKPADERTIKTRKKVSALQASFNALWWAVRGDEICESVGIKPDELRRVYSVIMEMATQAEDQAKADGHAPDVRRIFRCASFIAESFYRRKVIPRSLADDGKKKRREAYGRAWRERWAMVHLFQCHSQMPFVERERRTFDRRDRARKAAMYTERMADLLGEIARRAGAKRGNIQAYNRAAVEVLKEFQLQFGMYAPEFEPDVVVDDDAPAPEKAAEEVITAAAVDPYMEARKALRTKFRRDVKWARELTAAHKLTDGQSLALRAEIQAEIETWWTETLPEAPTPASPENDNDPRPARYRVPPPVLVMADRADSGAPQETKTAPVEADAWRIKISANEKQETQICSGNLAFSLQPDAQKTHIPTVAARLTVEAMQSVGADKFKVVFLGCVPVGGQAECVGSEEIAPAALLGRVGELVQRSERRGQSVTLRAWGGRLVQVDDCPRKVMRRLLPFAFLAVETSPENFQTWLALSPDITDEARKDVRGRLLRKFAENGEGANGGAYNSLRLPGCLNAKEKYRQSLGHFPRVALTHVELGRTVAPLELEQAGLLAAPLEKPKPPIMPTSAKLPTGAMPDYNNYLADAGGDRSRADIRWSMAALGAGFPHYAVISHLEAMSGKAQGRHDDYARKTVDNAAAFVAASSVTKAGRERVSL